MSHLVVLVLVLTLSTITWGRNIKPISPSLEGRIVGGVNVTIEEYPYTVALDAGSLGHWCGGSLIRPNVVLTAAHCMVFLPKWYSVRAGSTFNHKGGQYANVTDVCKHPKYAPRNYDIAVIKLDRAFELNSAVQLISLQNIGEEVEVGTMATVTGWGTLEWKGEPSENLQKVEVPKVDHKKCQEQNSPNGVGDSMTCYGYTEGGKDACSGDSGGPLVVNGKQVGIVSYGYECARPNKPGVYTSIENEEVYDHINSCLILINSFVFYLSMYFLIL